MNKHRCSKCKTIHTELIKAGRYGQPEDSWYCYKCKNVDVKKLAEIVIIDGNCITKQRTTKQFIGAKSVGNMM